MKIYVVQYHCSMSPIGEIIAVRSSLERAQKGAQESENTREFPYIDGRGKDAEPEILVWAVDRVHGPWNANGYGGVYTISEWEVST